MMISGAEAALVGRVANGAAGGGGVAYDEIRSSVEEHNGSDKIELLDL